jgi:hypothetical protein
VNPWISHQADVRAAIEASAYFTGVPIITDTGNILEAYESALKSPGMVLVIGYPLDFNAIKQVAKVVEGQVTGRVALCMNAISNSEQATAKNFVEAASALVTALAEAPINDARRGFQIQSVDLNDDDAGIFCYAVTFTRPVLIR